MRPLAKFIALLVCAAGCVAAQTGGFVKSSGQPIPGATITLVQNGQTLTTVTDRDGHYGFYEVAPGTWTVTVEMFGFETLKKDMDFASAKGPVNFDIQLKESQMLQRMQRFAQGGGGTGGPGGGGFRGGGMGGGGTAAPPGVGGGQPQAPRTGGAGGAIGRNRGSDLPTRKIRNCRTN